MLVIKPSRSRLERWNRWVPCDPAPRLHVCPENVGYAVPRELMKSIKETRPVLCVTCLYLVITSFLRRDNHTKDVSLPLVHIMAEILQLSPSRGKTGYITCLSGR